MAQLPARAKVFLLIVYSLGVAAFLGSLLPRWPHRTTSVLEPCLIALLALWSGSTKINLTRRKANRESGSMSLGFALTYTAMLRFGLTWAVIIGTVSGLVSCLYPKRHAWHQATFNTALAALETFCASLVFLALNAWSLVITVEHTIIAVCLSTMVYFLVNTCSVATIIGLCCNRKPVDIWNESFLVTAPTFFYGAGAATIAVRTFGSHTTFIILALAPVAYVTYRSFSATAQRIEDLQLSQQQLAELYLATIKSLALAIDAKDQYTHQHILRVQRYAVATARKMNIEEKDLEGVNTGALLHDIGKLGVPEYVLLKPGRLTEEEFAKIKQHPSIGAAILAPVEFPWPVLSVVKHHHEKWDGSGYPDGLKGEEIPLTARILAVADVYDALTSNRAYRTAWTHERAITHIKHLAGMHLDAQVVDAFLEVVDSVATEIAMEDTSLLAPTAEAGGASASRAAEAAHQIQQTSIELFALYEVAQTLSCSLGLNETLHILAWKLESIFPGTTCVFMLRDDQDRLQARSVVGINQEFFKGAHPLNEASPTERVMRDHQTYYGDYDPDDLLLTSTPVAQWNPLKTSLIVPIIHQGMTLGTINFYHTETDAFSNHVRHLLETIAERAAMPIYNGILFDRTHSNAITDSLTGLYNVRHLTEYVQERMRQIEHYRKAAAEQGAHTAQQSALLSDSDEADWGNVPIRESDRFSILCLDLDSFKAINDNFGHQRGDKVLRDVSTIFRSMTRATDLVARYGGDEFVILLDAVSPMEACAMADRLQSAVEAYDTGLVHERLGMLKLGISIGVASYPEDGEEWQALLGVADHHMYHDKTDRKLGRLIEHSPLQSDSAAA